MSKKSCVLGTSTEEERTSQDLEGARHGGDERERIGYLKSNNFEFQFSRKHLFRLSAFQ